MADLNTAQELFVIFFAIYFSLIIDRANRTYVPYDTFNAWRRSRPALIRLITALVILHLLPLLQFAIVFILLGGITLTFYVSISGILDLMAIGFLSFFDFGYYRIFEAFLYRYPNVYYLEGELTDRLDGTRFEFWSHFIPGILYLLSSVFLLLIIYYQ